MFEKPRFTDVHKLALKVLRKSFVLIDEIKTDQDRRNIIKIKYELSKCVHIYKLLRDYAMNPTDEQRWNLVSFSERNIMLRDNTTNITFNIWHTYSMNNKKTLEAKNIKVSLSGLKVLNDEEKVLLYVVCNLAIEVEEKLKRLETQQKERQLSEKLKGLY